MKVVQKMTLLCEGKGCSSRVEADVICLVGFDFELTVESVFYAYTWNFVRWYPAGLELPFPRSKQRLSAFCHNCKAEYEKCLQEGGGSPCFTSR